MIILLHSSKTMRSPDPGSQTPTKPQLLDSAERLGAYLKTLTPAQLAAAMHISPALAAKTQAIMAAWTTAPARQSLAIDSFVGDIYSGLRASTLSPDDREYANQTLRILSGLYGILRPFDGVRPYRLEMGYRLPDPDYANLYDFWGRMIADTLPAGGIIVNASSAEYTRTILPFVAEERVITPRFLTVDPKTGTPEQVIVHTKIARGAFARWLVTSRTTEPKRFSAFDDIGYRYDPASSTLQTPTFICSEFAGKGLSMRVEG
jgi:cytoplasmic iron level regulating protein YaaA (DUF328/UPF0246 family)